MVQLIVLLKVLSIIPTFNTKVKVSIHIISIVSVFKIISIMTSINSISY
jgi:hypothetical protein